MRSSHTPCRNDTRPACRSDFQAHVQASCDVEERRNASWSLQRASGVSLPFSESGNSVGGKWADPACCGSPPPPVRVEHGSGSGHGIEGGCVDPQPGEAGVAALAHEDGRLETRLGEVCEPGVAFM